MRASIGMAWPAQLIGKFFFQLLRMSVSHEISRIRTMPRAPGSVSITGGTTSTPTITFQSQGVYRVGCTVTNSDAKSFTSYRYVFVVAEGSGATGQLVLNSMEGSYSSGGWKASVTLYDDASLTLVRDRALCILHTVDYYGDTKVSLGFAAGAENILMVGWVNTEDIEAPIAGMSGSVTFSIETIDRWLAQITAFPVGLKDRTGTPTKWTRWLGLTDKDTVWHQLHWRSTATRCTDVFPMDNQYRASRIEAPGAQTLWEQLKAMEWQYVRGTPCADRFNRLHNQVDLQVVPAATRAAVPTIRSITSADWGQGSINFTRVVAPPVSLVDLSGVSWDGVNVTAFASLAPGKVFSNWGRAETVDRLVLFDQATANDMCGYWFGWKTNQFPNIPMKIVENERFIDIAPYMYVSLSVAAADNPRGVGYTGLAIPRQVRYTHDPETMTLTMEAEFEAQTQKALAVTHIQPDIVVPIVQPPVIVPPPPVVPPSPTTDLVGMVMYVSEGTNQYLIYAGDFSYTSQPTWTTLALPPNFSLIEPVADGYDNIVYTPTNGSRLLVAGRRTIDTKHSIWECTNWTSIKGNPTPPAPSWTELVTYTVTTIGGATVNIVGTLTAGNLWFTPDGTAYFTCKFNTTYGLGTISAAGGLGRRSVTPANGGDFGIYQNCFLDMYLTGGAGVSRLYDFGGATILSASGSVFGLAETGSPYRNDSNTAAVMGFFHETGTPDKVAIVSSSGITDMVNALGNDRVIFGGTPRASIITASISTYNNMYKSADGGATWTTLPLWGRGKAIGIKTDADIGFVWARYDSIASGSVPIRLVDANGVSVMDMTGNWWTGPFIGATSTLIKSFRGWYTA